MIYIHRAGAMFKAFIDVTATPGSTVSVTLTKNNKTFTATANPSGVASFVVKKKGTYSVTSNATGTQTKTIDVLINKQTYTVNITGQFTLSFSPQKINDLDATSITVNRKSSQYAGASTGNLSTGDYIYYGDVLTISNSVDTTVYNTPELKVNNNTFTTGNDFTVQNQNVTVTSTTTVKSYALTFTDGIINNKQSTTITVRRTSSTYQGANSSVNLSTGDTIYYGDALTISVVPYDSDIYNTPSLTVNGASYTSGNSHTVTNNVTVTASTTVKSYKLTITNQSINSKTSTSITVNRKSSDNQGANTGNLATNADIYYGDVLTISTAPTDSNIYNTPSLTVNTNAFTSGNDYTVTSATTASATTTVKSYTLTISNQTINSKTSTSITVNRKSSTNQGANTGNLSNGATIYYGDVLTCTAAAANATIYNAPTMTVAGTTRTSPYDQTVTAATTVAATTDVKNWKVTITNATINSKSAATVTVNRQSSTNKGAATGNLATNAVIYYGDVLKISVANANSTIYNAPTLKVNNSTFTSGNTHTVSAAVAAVATSSVKSYTLTLTNATINSKSAATVGANRKSSTNQGAATGALSNGATVYYGDVITCTVTNANSTVYNAPTMTVAGTARSSGYEHTVTAAFTIAASSSVKSFTITYSKGTGSTLSLQRTESTYAGASLSTYTANFTGYYGDKIKVTSAAETNYTLSSLKWGSTAISSGSTQTATAAVTVASTATANFAPSSMTDLWTSREQYTKSWKYFFRFC